ncbi:MAG TPA: hypothetical protein VEA77_02245 [Hyphomicrobium sp.]|nr:hypothetical protein [Hyphomicrobium sp.]
MTIRRSAPRFAVVVGVCLMMGSGPIRADDTAAHAMAEKFAGGAEKEEAKRKTAEATKKAEQAKRKADEAKRRQAEEAEMLERARAEAMERKAAADKARAEEEAQRLADEQRAEDARRLAEEQRIARDKFIADQLRADEERRVADEAKAAEERRLAEEHRLAEEKRIADEKRAEEDRRVAEEKHRADEERMAAEKRAEDERRLAEEHRRAEEERLAAEKRADEERIAAEKRAEDERRLAEEQRAAAEKRAEEQRIAEQRRLEDVRRLAEEQHAAEENRRLLTAEREAEHRNLTEKLLRLERDRNARKALADKEPMGLGAKSPAETSPAAAPVTAPAVASSTPPTTRVTVLLVMDSGSNGIRRYGKKTADPVLCSGQRCWVSAGTDRIATAMSRAQALGPANTLGRRAAACNQHLVCVFRDVDLKSASASIQPIDLRIMRHDRRQPLALEADRSCRKESGTLVCDKLYATGTWRAWVVPESVAAEAGAPALDAALQSGLGLRHSAALTTGE